jgi:hypothetical protein
VGAGDTYIAPSIPPVPRSNSGFRLSETRLLQSSSSRKPCRLLVIPGRRVITVDGNPSYPKVIAELKQEWKLGRRCRYRTCPYLNNTVEQDHRAIKRRVNASQGFRLFDGAWRTIQGYEVVHMIQKAK